MSEFPDDPVNYQWFTIEMDGMPVLEFTDLREARLRWTDVCTRQPKTESKLVKYTRKELRTWNGRN